MSLIILAATKTSENHDLLIGQLFASALVFFGVVITGFIAWSNNRAARQTAVISKEISKTVSEEILSKLDTGNGRDIGNTVHDIAIQGRANAEELREINSRLNHHLRESAEDSERLLKLQRRVEQGLPSE